MSLLRNSILWLCRNSIPIGGSRSTFLNIAIAHWPQIFADNHLVDPARRRMLLVEREIARIDAGHMAGPVIAIGSTGTNRATARLLAAIARAPQGAVVLPGLDRDLDDAAWLQIGTTSGRRRRIPASVIRRPRSRAFWQCSK